LRAMRVVPPCQLALGLDEIPIQEGHWPGLPEDIRGQIQGLLVRLIIRGALTESQDDPTSTATSIGVVKGER
jgi:hypothetical protein